MLVSLHVNSTSYAMAWSWAPCTLHTLPDSNVDIKEEYIYTEDKEIIQRHYTR